MLTYDQIVSSQQGKSREQLASESNALVYGNPSATTPKDQYVNNLSATSTPSTPVTNPVKEARSSYLDTFNPTSDQTNAKNAYLGSFDPNPSLTAARQAYLDSLNPSAAVSGAKKAYSDFTNSVESGLNRISDKAIPMTFITGQQASLRRNSEATARRLQGDVGLAEEEAQNYQNRAKVGLDFASTDFTSGQNKAQAALGFANEGAGTVQNKAQANLGFANEDAALARSDKEAATAKANTLADGFPFYKYPGSAQVFDSKTNQPVDYNQYKAAGGIGVQGQGAFGDVKEVVGATGNKLLSVTEAKALGVPYGTTQSQAANLSITPTTNRTTPPKVTLTQATNAADDDLKNATGPDGFVSPEQFQQSRKEWIDLGMDVNTFYSRFKKYVNPADPQDYI